MAEKTVKAAGGNYNAAATWEPEGVPVAGDDVFCKSTSGNLTITAAAVCRSINCTGYVGTLKHEAFTLTIGATTAPPEGKALVFAAGMTYTITNVTTSKITFASTVASTTHTVDFKGKTTGSIQIEPANSSGTKFLSEHKQEAAASVNWVKGFLDLNGQTVTWGTFASSNTNTREWKPGAASIIVIGTGTSTWNMSTSTGLTVAENTATLTFETSTNGQFTSSAAGINYNGMSVVMKGTGANVLRGTATIKNFTRSAAAVKGGELQFLGASCKLVCTGKFKCVGETLTNRLYIRNGEVFGEAVEIEAATTEIENSDFSDIKATGAAEWKGLSIGNGLGNSGITFTTAVERFAKAAGSWSSTAVWSATSGGAAGASVPLCHDKVIMDSNAGAGTYTMDMPRACADLECNTGFIRTLTQSTNVAVYGSMTFVSGQAAPGLGSTHLFRGRGSHTITSAGKPRAAFTIEAPGGTYKLEDAVKIGATGNLNITHTTGTLNTNGQKVEFGRLISTGSLTRTLTLGTSELVSANNEANILNLGELGLTFNGSESKLVLSAKFTEFKEVLTITVTERTFGTVEFTATEAEAQLTNGPWTLTKLVLTPGGKYRFTTATTTLTSAAGLVISGEAGKLVTITTKTEGSRSTVIVASGTVSVHHVSLRDSKAEGGAAFFAANSTNVSGNSGWLFESPGWKEAVADAVGVTDVLAGETGIVSLQIVLALADSVAAADSASKAAGVPLADAVGAADALSKAAAALPADAVSVADSASKTPGLALPDALALADSLSKVVGLKFADALSLADVLAVGAQLVLADAVGVADARAKSATVPLAAELAVADAVSKTTGVTFADSVTAADAAAKQLGIGVADLLAVVDAVGTVLSGSGELLLSLKDALTVADAIAEHGVFFRRREGGSVDVGSENCVDSPAGGRAGPGAAGDRVEHSPGGDQSRTSRGRIT